MQKASTEFWHFIVSVKRKNKEKESGLLILNLKNVSISKLEPTPLSWVVGWPTAIKIFEVAASWHKLRSEWVTVVLYWQTGTTGSNQKWRVNYDGKIAQNN